MQKKSISLKIFISKGELDLEMLQEGGECGPVGWAGDWESGLLACCPGSATDPLCDSGQVTHPACATRHHHPKFDVKMLAS